MKVWVLHIEGMGCCLESKARVHVELFADGRDFFKHWDLIKSEFPNVRCWGGEQDVYQCPIARVGDRVQVFLPTVVPNPITGTIGGGQIVKME